MFQTKGTATQATPRKEASEKSVARGLKEASDTSISVSRGLWSTQFICSI